MYNPYGSDKAARVRGLRRRRPASVSRRVRVGSHTRQTLKAKCAQACDKSDPPKNIKNNKPSLISCLTPNPPYQTDISTHPPTNIYSI